MIKIDLITGFLGAGKTTFLKGYVRYHISRGERVCILENDYGAVNVDMMLIQELAAYGCDTEMVAGGCDADCHRRRFRTKLIAMGMSGYDRVIVEPSGIYDTDEFFDALREEPLDGWYATGSVIAIVDAGLPEDLSPQSEYVLASEIAGAGVVVYSHIDDIDGEPRTVTDRVTAHINRALAAIGADRTISEVDIIACDMRELSAGDYARISGAGYVLTDYRKQPVLDDNDYDSVYIMDRDFTETELRTIADELLANAKYGRVIRVKGFFRTIDDTAGDIDNKPEMASQRRTDGDAVSNTRGWYEFNATGQSVTVSPLEDGQRIIIVIGERLDKAGIEQRFSQNR